jgi:ATP-binding protein involved in chromosome partitioning
LQISGLVLNQAYMLCPTCDTRHEIFGSAERFNTVAKNLGANVLGELPLVPGVSKSGDTGKPYILADMPVTERGGMRWKDEMSRVASALVDVVHL